MLPAPDKIVGIVSPPKAFEGRNDVVFCRFGLGGKFHRVAQGIQPLDGSLVGRITIGVAFAVDLDEFHHRHVDDSKTVLGRAVERRELLLEIDLVHVRLWSVGWVEWLVRRSSKSEGGSETHRYLRPQLIDIAALHPSCELCISST